MDKNLLIVGVDPGTTTAYAALDIEGNLIKVKSQKELGLNSIIKETADLGKVVLVGTDKKKVPNLIEAFSAKIGAKVINPINDLKVLEKKEIMKNFDFKAKDEHQSDAIASALFAFKKINPLMKKIDFIVKNNPNLKNHIKDTVIKKNISIYEAIKILKPEKKEEEIIIEKLVEDKEFNEQDFNKLYERLKTYNKENKLLREYNNKLKRRLQRIEGRFRDQKIKRSNFLNSKIDRIFVFKEKRLRNYENIIIEKNHSMELMKREIKKLINIIVNTNQFYILKKLNTLGSSQFETRKILLNIQKDDILLVDNPNILSRSTINELSGVVNIIVHNKPVSRKVKMNVPFIFISSKNLGIQDLGVIAAVGKNRLDEEKKRHNILYGIIENYKKERLSLI